MNTILEKSKQMPYYTDLRLVFDALCGRQKEFNWLITDLDCNCYPEGTFTMDRSAKVWISGDELTDIVYKHRIQFIWAVLSGFDRTLRINLDDLIIEPYADGNPGFWVDNPQIQHPQAIVEIVCWDSGATLLLSKDDDLTLKFRTTFTDAKDLNEYNASIK